MPNRDFTSIVERGGWKRIRRICIIACTQLLWPTVSQSVYTTLEVYDSGSNAKCISVHYTLM